MAGAPIELLGRVPLFQGLEKRELEGIAGSMKERTFPAGAEVSTQGEGGIGFFVIEAGTARVTVHGEERATLGPGQSFGEVALIGESPRTATIVAETELRCWGMSSWSFRPIVESNAAIAWKLLQAFAKMLR